MYKILVIYNEPPLEMIMEEFLSREDYLVKAWVGDGIQTVVREFEPNLILLDIIMPVKGGFELCKEIRQVCDIPIIILSAKSGTLDRILGLTLGADDFLAKPFDFTELLLRIRAILRRANSADMKANKEVLRNGDLIVDYKARIVKKKGKVIELTSKEFDLLWLLASNSNQVFTRSQLIYQVWDSDYYQDTAIVTMLIKRLREKIESDKANPIYIKTVRGIGYKFRKQF